MHGFGPHLVAALSLPRAHYEPDDDLRTLRRLTTGQRVTAPPRRRFRLRLRRRETDWVTVSAVRRDEGASETTA